MGDAAILTLDAFQALYPWPAALLAHGEPLEWLWHFDVACSPDALWPYLSDTSRFNRALGLPDMRFQERQGVLHGESVNGGMRQVWLEEPWDWVAGQYLEAIRRYSRGFAHVARAIYRLEPRGTGTRLYVYFGWIPRHWLSSVILRIGMNSLGKDYQRVIRAIEHDIATTRPAVYHQPAPALPEAATARVQAIRTALRERLRAQDWPAVDQLIEHVTTADELDLSRIQVRALARAWGVDEHQLLRICLHATRAGLLNLTWDVVCPHCRGVRSESTSLGDVPALGICEVCQIDFTTDKENAVEVSFRVHPAIREVPERFFCSAEPAFKQHIRVQRQVAAGAELDISTRLEPGRYRLRLKGQSSYRLLDIVAGCEAGRLVWQATDDSTLASGPDPSIRIVNDTDQAQTFVLERAQWSDLALRPAVLFNLQEFRDLFSEEYLAADVQLAVGEQTLLFTDIVGSTRFYAQSGDPKAFMEVRKHFAELFEVVSQHNGAVVKTIGDAVMGAFGTPLDAVRAAVAIHERFHEHREDTPIRLRISLNTGPCIAVNLNTNIDYFGGTVNLAAKLQACAEAGDIALSEAVMAAPGVRGFLGERGAEVEEMAFRSSALSSEVRVWCWHTFGGARSSASRSMSMSAGIRTVTTQSDVVEHGQLAAPRDGSGHGVSEHGELPASAV